MNSLAAPQYSGFTLVELAIVLVIIGLIIGGIMVGADLIQVAEVRSQVRQIQTLQTQISVFRSKYDCLPGDCASATTFFGTTDANGRTITNGDGDGFIRSTVGAGAPYASGECAQGGLQGSEVTQAFLQLDDGGAGNYTSDGADYRMGTGWPKLSGTNNSTGILVTCLNNPANGVSTMALDPSLRSDTVIVLGAYSNAGGSGNNRIVYLTGLSSYGSQAPIGLPIKYVIMIDQKIDDGLPASGAFGVVGAYGTDAINVGTACLASSNTAYPALSSTCTATVASRL